jgi:putative membrane protein
MKKLAILVGALLAACASNPPPPPPPPPAVDLGNPLLAPGFLAQAGSANQLEIDSSQLALQVSQNIAVRNFANLMIAEHMRLGQGMAAAASSAGLAMPAPALLPPHQAALDQLRASGAGPSFDMAYKQLQVGGHQQAIALFQNYVASGDVAALQAAASQAVPVMQMHLAQAQMLNVAPPPPPPMPAPAPGHAGERG